MTLVRRFTAPRFCIVPSRPARLSLLLAIACTVLLSGCGLFDPGPPGAFAPSLTVYVAGSYDQAAVTHACYWANTDRFELPGDGVHSARATSVFADQGHLYVGGSYDNGNVTVPCYWKDGARVDLPGDGIHGGAVRSLVVSEGIVYTAGHYENGTTTIGCYWKGTERTDLPGDGTYISQAWSIAVWKGTVYTSGSWASTSPLKPPVSCYWTGTSRTDMAFQTGVGGIYVDSGTLYLSGNFYNVTDYQPCYWVGSTRIRLPCPIWGSADTIYASSGLVYVGGHGHDGGLYWKGNDKYNFVGVWPRCIYGRDGIAYTCGDSSSLPYQAADGNSVLLPTPEGKGTAEGIFVY